MSLTTSVVLLKSMGVRSCSATGAACEVVKLETKQIKNIMVKGAMDFMVVMFLCSKMEAFYI